MWQAGIQVKRPKLEIKNDGRSVDQKVEKGNDAPLTADNLVIQLPEPCYVDTERKTRLLTCGRDPEQAANDNHGCKRCDCEENMYSLFCRCKGRCYTSLRRGLPQCLGCFHLHPWFLLPWK